jgi:hypothetical protein
VTGCSEEETVLPEFDWVEGVCLDVDVVASFIAFYAEGEEAEERGVPDGAATISKGPRARCHAEQKQRAS